MTAEKLLYYIGEIDDSFIMQADISSSNGRTEKRFRLRWIPVIAAAAVCLALVIPFVLNRSPRQENIISDNSAAAAGPQQPQMSGAKPADENEDEGGSLSSAEDADYGAAFGFEGYLAYDISQLSNANPWKSDNDLATLPVFRNTVERDSAGQPLNLLSSEEMLQTARQTADLFGLVVIAEYTTPTAEEIERILEKLQGEDEQTIKMNTIADKAVAECVGAYITVNNDGSIVMTLTPETTDLINEIEKLNAFDDFAVMFDFGYELTEYEMYSIGLPLPDGYEFSYLNTSYEQAMKVTEYLFSQYCAFAGITEPGYNLFADYTFSGDICRLHTAVFENSGSLTERILNYNFNNIYFLATDKGGLAGIRFIRTDLSQKTGDYPIITVEKARELLSDNRYDTTVPEGFPGQEYIANAELIYKTGALEKEFKPYYRFLVEMPGMERENGLKTFGAFYVPAVDE